MHVRNERSWFNARRGAGLRSPLRGAQMDSWFVPPIVVPIMLEHYSIRLGVSRVREISVAFFFGNTFEKRGDCSPKLLDSASLHFA